MVCVIDFLHVAPVYLHEPDSVFDLIGQSDIYDLTFSYKALINPWTRVSHIYINRMDNITFEKRDGVEYVTPCNV